MIQMKKFAGVAVAVAGILALTGFSVAEVREYLTVARNRVATSVRREIHYPSKSTAWTYC